MLYKKNNISFFYEQYGFSSKNIIILPGWGNTKNTFLEIIQSFQKDYSIYILDYPGFGNSPLPTKELTIYDYAEIIQNWIKDLEIKNPIIIAHSFGGRITSILLGKYQLKVQKIILIDVAGIKRKKTLKVFLKEKLYKILKKAAYLLPKRKQEKYKQKLLWTFGSSDYKNIPISLQKTFQNIIKEDLKRYYKLISTETLIIWGEKDMDTPLKDAYLLNKIIKNSALIVLKNASHYSYLNQSFRVILIINAFIKND